MAVFTTEYENVAAVKETVLLECLMMITAYGVHAQTCIAEHVALHK